MNDKILIADDENTFRETLSKVLREEGLNVTDVGDGASALDEVTKHQYAICILDIRMPKIDGIKVLREIMNIRPETRVIMMTAYGSVDMAVDAIKLGACDYVVKPVIIDDILTKIRQHMQYLEISKENKKLKEALLQNKFGIEQIIGKSSSMQMVFEMIRKVAPTKSNVLVTGASGTGKELVARAIHSLGLQKDKQFVAVNCGAIPENLLESELFGHKKGSFTSAYQDKKGFFESANGGTLFLDEIGHMPLVCQVKLLRAVEQRQIIPIGSTEPVNIDVRLIAATNKNLEKEIEAGRFREDLYYRINVVGIYLPTLQERKEDIPLLVEHFIKKYNYEIGKNCTGVSDDVIRLFMCYDWKGNVREMQNVIERAFIFAEGEKINISDMGFLGSQVMVLNEGNEDLHDALKAYEKEYISLVLNRYNWDKGKTAKALNIGLSSLYRKMEELKIDNSKQDKTRKNIA